MKGDLQQVATERRFGDVLTLLACAALEAARFDAHGLNIATLSITLAVIAGAFAARWWLDRSRARGIEQSTASLLIVGTIIILPAIAEWASQAWYGLGQAREFTLCALLRDLLLAALATASTRRRRQLVGLLSLFLVIFIASQATDRWTWLLVVLFGISGAGWLAVSYWSGLGGQFAERQSHRIPPASTRRRWLPKIVIISVVAMLVVVPLFVGATLLSANSTTALAGWFGTSGGTGKSDPFARAGVNDGDALVQGTEQAESFGPIESDVFLANEEQSLYDVFNDMYGEPKKLKKLERAVALDSTRTKTREEQHWAENRKLSREFSTVRHRPLNSHRKKMHDVDAPALLYVAGRTPLHLRMEVFNHFDGRDWTSQPDPVELQRKPPLTVQQSRGKPWIGTGLLTAFLQPTHDDTHAIKVVRLDTNHIPVPPRLKQLHIDKIDQADFFAWGNGDAIEMTRDKIPSCTIIHMVSQTPSREHWAALPDPAAFNVAYAEGAKPMDPDAKGRLSRTAQLAADWAANAPRGWAQVEAIVGRLRERCQYASGETVPETCDDTVEHFLFESRRGPDYMFASAAAVLLQHLGYSTRAVSGFYANPDRYDSRSRHTPVLSSDVHFWAEVELGGGAWATVEATPGFEILEPPLGIGQKCWRAATSILSWCWIHTIELAACLATMVCSVLLRHRLYDVVLRCRWWVASHGSNDRCVRATTQLLDYRFRWAGRARPAFITPASWFCCSMPDAATHDASCRLAAMLDWSLYAPVAMREQTCEWPPAAVRDACAWAVRHWSVQRCRTVIRPHSNPESAT